MQTIGVDTGDSLRNLPACTSTAGFKPPYGSISRHEVVRSWVHWILLDFWLVVLNAPSKSVSFEQDISETDGKLLLHWILRDDQTLDSL
jgi:hypothetical protein